MRQDDVLEMLRQRPFEPFRIHISDGVVYEVHHPEMVMVGRSRVLIFFPDARRAFPAFDRYDSVALLHITRLEPMEAKVQQGVS